MGVRVWRPEPVRRGDSVQSRVVIRCECGAVDSLANCSHERVLPPDAVDRIFRRRGWHVGRTGPDDQCPACARGSRAVA